MTTPAVRRKRGKKSKKSDVEQPVSGKATPEKTASTGAALPKVKKKAKRRTELQADPSRLREGSTAGAELVPSKRLGVEQKDFLRAHERRKSNLSSGEASGKVATERQAVSVATEQLGGVQVAKKRRQAPDGSAPVSDGGETSPTVDAAPLGTRKRYDKSHCAKSSSNSLECKNEKYHYKCRFIRP